MIGIHPVHRRLAELQLIAEYKAAHIYFDQAPPERAEEAVYRLAAAEKRLDGALRQLKAEREQAKRPG